MKVALIHDVLFGRGGAERVFLNFCEAFPNADIYTSVYLPDETYDEFKNYKIRTSFLNHFIRSEKLYKYLFFPFVVFSMSNMRLKNYDLILVSTTHCAKYPKMDEKAVKVFYCYTPFRLAWNPESYKVTKTNIFFGKLIVLISHILRKIDYKSAQKADLFIAMTDETKQRIKSSYNYFGKIPIIKPTVNIDRFKNHLYLFK